jgi:nucleotide-binding universal stress UspA family protein
MAPYRRVLVGIGGSARDRDALTLARRLIEPRAGELTLAHVDDDRSFQVLRPQPRAAPAELLAAARTEVASGIAVSVRSRHAASVARGLTELADEADADIIVVGSAAPRVTAASRPGGSACGSSRARHAPSRWYRREHPTQVPFITSVLPSTARPRPRRRLGRASRSPPGMELR